MIAFNNVTKQYGNRILYQNGSFQINPGEKIGLVGPNGAGKTTVFKLIMGEEGVDGGTVTKPERLRIGYFSQTVAEMHGGSALEQVKSAHPRIGKIQKRMQELDMLLQDPEISEDKMSKALEEYGKLQEEFEEQGGYTLESRAQEILTGLGIGPEDFNRPVESFSGGWKMRIELAKILAIDPEVLLMDEPTNHLDLESIIWLENWLMNYKGAILMTSHDRQFMNRLVTKIIEIAHRTITVYGGNYDFYARERELRREQLIAAARRQEDMLAKEEEFIARFAARASHAAQVQSRVKKIEKIDRIEIPVEEEAMKFEWPVPPRGGDEVVKLEGLKKIWKKEDGTEKLVFSGVTGLVKRQDRVAVVGVNGAGKSTLLKVIANQTFATEGKCTIGASVSIGYFSQNSLDVLDPKKTVFDEVHDRIPNSSVGFVRSLLGAFKFSQEEVEKKVSVLSGGEKSRLVLATILANPVNLLILDEPTNHLDIVSREVLLEAIKNFPGTVLIVSHDRFFLTEVATRVFEVDRNKVSIYDGDYNYYLEKKAAQT